jgi:hypothetical protein
MNTLRLPLLRALAAAILCLLPSFAVASSTPLGDELGELYGSVEVPSGLSADTVQKAVVASLAGREWAIKDRTDTQVVGYLKHRSNEAKVTLVYSTEKVDIYCVGYAIKKSTGERKKPELPTGWLKYLKSDLTKQINGALVAQ